MRGRRRVSARDSRAQRPHFSTWRLAWIAHALRTDPRHLFDANIFWPERLARLLGCDAARSSWRRPCSGCTCRRRSSTTCASWAGCRKRFGIAVLARYLTGSTGAGLSRRRFSRWRSSHRAFHASRAAVGDVDPRRRAVHRHQRGSWRWERSPASSSGFRSSPVCITACSRDDDGGPAGLATIADTRRSIRALPGLVLEARSRGLTVPYARPYVEAPQWSARQPAEVASMSATQRTIWRVGSNWIWG